MKNNFYLHVRRNVKQEHKEFFLWLENCNLKYKSGLKADFADIYILLVLFKNDKNLLNLNKLSPLK